MGDTPRWLREAARCVPLLAVTGCAAGPDYVRPELPAPSAWAQPANSGPAVLLDWWERFGDDQLAALVNEATRNNRDLRVAFERVIQVRELLGVTWGQRLPLVSSDGEASRGRLGGPFGGSTMSNFVLNASATWELDLFGRVRRSVEAASADFEVIVEDYHGLLARLQADVALAYIDARLAQRRLGIATTNAELQTRALQLVTKRHEAGLAHGLDLAQARANLATTQATVPLQEAALDRATNRLAVLLGKHIADTRKYLIATRPIPAAAEQLVSGVPADLIRNRPDLRAAERALAAETARVGVAIAQLYPRFDISAALGFQAASLGDLVRAVSRTSNTGLRASWDVFNFDALRSSVRAQEAVVRQQLATYEQTLFVAVEEVESAMATQRRQRKRGAALRRAVAAYRNSVSLSEELYRGRQANFQSYLDSQRSLLDAEDQLALSDAAVAQATVQLFLALGGSWRPSQQIVTDILAAD
ncbi:MAG: efflux transporter outer membrane subunit [Planctomycetota bacterium]